MASMDIAISDIISAIRATDSPWPSLGGGFALNLGTFGPAKRSAIAAQRRLPSMLEAQDGRLPQAAALSVTALRESST
jgi:hypothetical protein